MDRSAPPSGAGGVSAQIRTTSVSGIFSKPDVGRQISARMGQ